MASLYLLFHDTSEASARPVIAQLKQAGHEVHLLIVDDQQISILDQVPKWSQLVAIWPTEDLAASVIYRCLLITRHEHRIWVIRERSDDNSKPLNGGLTQRFASNAITLANLITSLGPQEVAEFAACARPTKRHEELLLHSRAFRLESPTVDILVQEAIDKEEGRLVHKIPEMMTKGEVEEVEIRLGGDRSTGLTFGLIGGGKLVEEKLPILETMTIHLSGSSSGEFKIDPLTRETQLVLMDNISDRAPGFVAAEMYGRWLWHVTPNKTGKHHLIVRVSADLADSRGIPSSAALPDKFFKVVVRVGYARRAAQISKWLTTTAAGAVVATLVGAYTQDAWWPVLQSWLFD